MAIIKSIPAQRLIHGRILDTSEVSIVSEKEYSTNGEECIIVRGVIESTITLNSRTTDHIVIKSMTTTIIKPDINKIDEELSDNNDLLDCELAEIELFDKFIKIIPRFSIFNPEISKRVILTKSILLNKNKCKTRKTTKNGNYL